MRRVAVAFLASTFVTGAMAADAVVYEEPAPVAVTFFSWTGGYVGLHAGYAWGRENDNLSDFILEETPLPQAVDDEPLTADEFDVDGFIGGAHAGYNWQSGNYVFGVEGDIDYADITGGSDFDYVGDGDGRLGFKSDWQGSLRARLGYAMDTWLLYATGGIAFGHAELDASAEGVSATDDNTHIGWTVGAGVEKAFTPNWIGRLEVRYTDFGSEGYDLGDFGEVESDWNQTAVTAGISYKF